MLDGDFSGAVTLTVMVPGPEGLSMEIVVAAASVAASDVPFFTTVVDSDDELVELLYVGKHPYP